jgi:D-alanine-D-alanine ligase
MKILIITGGKTAEREISIRSSASVMFWLSPYCDIKIVLWPDEKKELQSMLRDFDCIIPMIHGRGGEDGEVQRILDQAQVPYLFSSPDCHAQCLDKRRAKSAVTDFVRVPEEYSQANYILPLVAKDPLGGSSIDVQIIQSEAEVVTHDFSEYLLEEYISGREFTVGVVETEQGVVALPPIEIRAKGFFNFAQKYTSDQLAEEICPAPISASLKETMKECAKKIHLRFGIRHISRSDFIVTKQGDIVFLEVNTIPGFTETSLIPLSAKVGGHTMDDLFLYWINSSVEQ